ncbi:AAA family ATPase [Schlesneria paludicola]|uniref:AAA family ATPase n=1 Tax=Schlesneria paludicola TaxID=360056 RepID=UPI00029A5947|nr:MoxR family ATPase [Schlesneria paludicola]
MNSILDRHSSRPSTADQDDIDLVRSRLNRALRGKSDVIEYVIACLLARGHLLLEDRPGLGKTTLAKALADCLGGRFARVQCTPDLLPSDITGFQLFNQRTHEFEFRAGPVFSEILLADEINRATPRTQSALLEAMAERQVTIDTVRHPLRDEFFVIATQNPHEQHGTYPLPEAQLDRFAMKLSIGYPEREHELTMLADAIPVTDITETDVESTWDLAHLNQIQRSVARVAVIASVQEYLVRLAELTRSHREISLGLSPRGLLTWQRVAQAWAYLNDRTFVTPRDIQEVAWPVLSVRLGIERDDPHALIDELLEQVPVPAGR